MIFLESTIDPRSVGYLLGGVKEKIPSILLPLVATSIRRMFLLFTGVVDVLLVLVDDGFLLRFRLCGETKPRRQEISHSNRTKMKNELVFGTSIIVTVAG
jgi:hypothetical protein